MLGIGGSVISISGQSIPDCIFKNHENEAGVLI